MIVPQTRLLFWSAVVVLPCGLLAAADPALAVFAGGGVAAFAALAGLDAIWSRRGLAGIEVRLPEIVRLSQDRAGAFELRIRNKRQTFRRLRLGLALPRELHSPHEDQVVELPAASEYSRLSWPCTARRRGHYRLDRTFLEVASPLGLWARRAAWPTPSEVRVYPNLLTERKNLAAFFLNRGAFGLHAQRQVGKGRDFEKLREYIPGDSYDEIHWKATARRGHPVTKVFQIERTQEVYVVLDASRLSTRTAAPARGVAPAPTGDPATLTVLDRFITAALVLGLAAEQQGDLFGLVTFSNQVDRFVRARNGQAHYSACRDALYSLEPRSVTPDFEELASFLRLRLRRRALLVVLTSLDDPVLAENFTRSLDLVSRQHLVLVNMLQPPDAQPLFSGATGATLDDAYRQLGGHVLWHNLRELGKTLQRRGVKFSLLPNERLAVELVSQYVGVKQRQLL